MESNRQVGNLTRRAQRFQLFYHPSPHTAGTGLRAFLGGLLLLSALTGCSTVIHTWAIQSTLYTFEPSKQLCEFKGKRLAIVPLSVGRGDDESHDFKTSPAWSVDAATAGGTLRYSIDGGHAGVLEGSFQPSDAEIGTLSAQLEKLGFLVTDRRHVANVLKEQDLQTVLSNDPPQVGRLLGADVLCIATSKATPIVYFASSGGSWAIIADMQVECTCTFLSASDGSHLGATILVSPVLSLCGYKRLVARRIDDGRTARTVLEARHRSGRVDSASNIDFVALSIQESEKYDAEDLKKWRSVCGD